MIWFFASAPYSRRRPKGAALHVLFKEPTHNYLLHNPILICVS